MEGNEYRLEETEAEERGSSAVVVEGSATATAPMAETRSHSLGTVNVVQTVTDEDGRKSFAGQTHREQRISALGFHQWNIFHDF